jgi:hypothetical protein
MCGFLKGKAFKSNSDLKRNITNTAIAIPPCLVTAKLKTGSSTVPHMTAGSSTVPHVTAGKKKPFLFCI